MWGDHSFDPITEQRPNRAHFARNIFVLAERQQPQIMGEAQIYPQLLKFGIGLGQEVVFVADFASMHDQFVEIKGGLLCAKRQGETMFTRIFERCRQQPQEEIVGFGKDRRFAHACPFAETPSATGFAVVGGRYCHVPRARTNSGRGA